MNRRALVVALGGAALIGAACGARAAPGGATTDETPSFSPLPHTIDWTHPFHGTGVEVPTVAAAQALMPFEIDIPDDLEDPALFVSPVGTPPDFMAMYFVYASSPYGIVWIAQSLPDIPDDQERFDGYRRRVAENGQPGLRSVAEIVFVRGGVTALVGTSEDGISSMGYVENGVQIWIMGPHLTRDDAMEIANSL